MNINLSISTIFKSISSISADKLSTLEDVAIVMQWMSNEEECAMACQTLDNLENALFKEIEKGLERPVIVAVLIQSNQWDVLLISESNSGIVVLSVTQHHHPLVDAALAKLSCANSALESRTLQPSFPGDRLQSWAVARSIVDICQQFMPESFPSFKEMDTCDDALREAVLEYINDSVESFIKDSLDEICVNKLFLQSFGAFFSQLVMPTKEFTDYVNKLKLLPTMSEDDTEASVDNAESEAFLAELEVSRKAMLSSFPQQKGGTAASTASLECSLQALQKYPTELRKLNQLFDLLGQLAVDGDNCDRLRDVALSLCIEPDRLIAFLALRKVGSTQQPEQPLQQGSCAEVAAPKQGVKLLCDIVVYPHNSAHSPTPTPQLHQQQPPAVGASEKTLHEIMEEYAELNKYRLQHDLASPVLDMALCERRFNLINDYFCTGGNITVAQMISSDGDGKGDGKRGVYENYKPVAKWEKEDIHQWSLYQQGKESQLRLEAFNDEDAFCQALAILDRAYQLLSVADYRLRKVQLLAVMCFVCGGEEQQSSLVAQVATGEGKTTIIALLAVIKVLQGYTVDIITSNEVLPTQAIDDKLEFYSLFNVSIATNNFNPTEVSSCGGARACYAADVVYGSISSFQFDYLGEKFDRLETRGSRLQSNTWVILDEIDSLLIDQGGHIAKVSTNFPGLDTLQYVYIDIWKRLHHAEVQLEAEREARLVAKAKELAQRSGCTEDERQQDYLQTEMQLHADFAESIMQLLRKELETALPLQLIPAHLHGFVCGKREKWIENALLAKYDYHEDVSYRVLARAKPDAIEGKEKEEDEERLVVLMDNSSTGATMVNTILSQGLHQFLQLKHNLRLTPETLTYAFISNIAYILSYGAGRMYGLTGTLGSHPEQALLRDIYCLNYAIIPSAFRSREQVDFPLQVVETEHFIDCVAVCALKHMMHRKMNVLEAVATAADAENVIKEVRPRAVLIICESIRDVDQIFSTIKAKAKSARLVIKVSQIRDEVESAREIREVGVQEIIVATNIAGRGADFRTTAELETCGGLHVIVAFLPGNQRVQQQAFGRTSRQGHSGSTQMIIRRDALAGIDLDYASDDEEVSDDGDHDEAAAFQAKIFAQCEKLETKRIENIRTEKLLELSFADALFERFLQLQLLFDENRIKDLTPASSDLENSIQAVKWIYLQKDIKEQWAFWLDEQNYCSSNIKSLLLTSSETVASKPVAPAAAAVANTDVVTPPLVALAHTEFSKFESLVQSRVCGKCMEWFDPFHCIALANECLDLGDYARAKNLMAVLGEDQHALAAYQLRMFEVSIEEGQVFMEKFQQALGKVLLLGLVERDTIVRKAYKQKAQLYLRGAKAAVEAETQYLQQLLCGRRAQSQAEQYMLRDMQFLLKEFCEDENPSNLPVVDTPSMSPPGALPASLVDAALPLRFVTFNCASLSEAAGLKAFETSAWLCLGEERIVRTTQSTTPAIAGTDTKSTIWSTAHFAYQAGTDRRHVITLIPSRRDAVSGAQLLFETLFGKDCFELQLIDLILPILVATAPAEPASETTNYQGKDVKAHDDDSATAAEKVSDMSGPVTVYCLTLLMQEQAVQGFAGWSRAAMETVLGASFTAASAAVETARDGQFASLDQRDLCGLDLILRDAPPTLRSMKPAEKLEESVNVLQSIVCNIFPAERVTVTDFSFTVSDGKCLSSRFAPPLQQAAESNLSQNVAQFFALVRIREELTAESVLPQQLQQDELWVAVTVILPAAAVDRSPQMFAFFPFAPSSVGADFTTRQLYAALFPQTSPDNSTDGTVSIKALVGTSDGADPTPGHSLARSVSFLAWLIAQRRQSSLPAAVSEALDTDFDFERVLRCSGESVDCEELLQQYEIQQRSPGTNLLLKHLQSRLVCLSASLANIDKVLTDLTDPHSEFNEADGLAMGGKMALSLQFDRSQCAEKSLADAVSEHDLKALSRSGQGDVFALRKITLVEDELIWSARGQIGFALTLYASGAAFPAVLPVAAPIANVFLSEGITDIINALINQGSVPYNRWEYVKGKLISYSISFLLLGLDALSKCKKFLRHAIQTCKKLSKFLRKSKRFPTLCRKLAKTIDRVQRHLKRLSMSRHFGTLFVAEQEQFLCSLKDARLESIRGGDLSNMQHLQLYQRLSKIKKTSDLVLSSRQIIFQSVKRAAMGALQGAVTSVCLKKTLSATLSKVLLLLLPLVQRKTRAYVQLHFEQQTEHMRTLRQRFTSGLVEMALVERCLIAAITDTTLESDMLDVLKAVSLGMLRQCNNWSAQLTELLLDGLDSLLTICSCVTVLSDNFIRAIEQQKHALTKSPSLSLSCSLEEMQSLLSEQIAQVIFDRISAYVTKAVTIVLKMLFQAYQKHREKRLDKQQIAKLDARLRSIVRADCDAGQMTCMYDVMGALTESTRDQLSDGSGVAPSNVGASVSDARELFAAAGIESAVEVPWVEGGDTFRDMNADRGLLLFPGHCEACFLNAEGEPCVRVSDGSLVSVQEYCQQNQLEPPSLLVGKNCNKSELATMRQEICRNRILHAYEPEVRRSGASSRGGPCFGANQPQNVQFQSTDFKKLKAEMLANNDRQEETVSINKSAANQLNVKTCIALLEENNAKLLPIGAQKTLFRDEYVHVDYKENHGYEMQLCGRGIKGGTTVVAVNMKTSIYSSYQKTTPENRKVIETAIQDAVYKRLLDGLKIFKDSGKTNGVRVHLRQSDISEALKIIESSLS